MHWWCAKNKFGYKENRQTMGNSSYSKIIQGSCEETFAENRIGVKSLMLTFSCRTRNISQSFWLSAAVDCM
jgi:hypothetical protein